MNVRPDEAEEGRQRGGSRPGLVKAFDRDLGGAVNMLAQVGVANSSGFTFWHDHFNLPTLADVWQTMNYGGGSEGLIYEKPRITPEDLSTATYQEIGHAVREDLPGNEFDPSQSYTVEMRILPYNGAYHGKYYLYALMDSSNNADKNGLRVSFESTAADGEIKIRTRLKKTYVTHHETLSPALVGVDLDKEGVLSITIVGLAALVYWNDDIVDQMVLPSIEGAKFGFGLECTEYGGVCLADWVGIQYYANNVVQERRSVVAASEGRIYEERTPGILSSFVTPAGADLLASEYPIRAAERYQKLFIADYDKTPIAYDTDGAANGTSFTQVSGEINFTDIGLNEAVHMLRISDAAVGATDGVYTITDFTATTLTLDRTAGTGACTFSIERAPKVFDPALQTVTFWETKDYGDGLLGEVPQGCHLICRYRDRMVLVKDNIFYMSRNGDPYDFDYAEEDPGAAYIGQGTEESVIGAPITAIIPYANDYMVIGCEHSLWIMRGDVMAGGRIDNISDTIGIVSAQAWCRGPGGELVFMTNDGSYALDPYAQAPPMPLSREMLPRELVDLNVVNRELIMAYDVRDRGVQIFIGGHSGSELPTHYWFDWGTKGFFPFELASYAQTIHSVLVDHTQAEKDGANNVLMGMRDGYIRRFARHADNDDGTAIDSYVLIGPIRLGGADLLGIIQNIVGILGVGSAKLRWAVYTGNTAEEAVRAAQNGSWSTAATKGTWKKDGVNYTDYPQVSGFDMVIRLESDSTLGNHIGQPTRRWMMEGIRGKIRESGRLRLL